MKVWASLNCHEVKFGSFERRTKRGNLIDFCDRRILLVWTNWNESPQWSVKVQHRITISTRNVDRGSVRPPTSQQQNVDVARHARAFYHNLSRSFGDQSLRTPGYARDWRVSSKSAEISPGYRARAQVNLANVLRHVTALHSVSPLSKIQAFRPVDEKSSLHATRPFHTRRLMQR
jgi:hypothetical protein